MAHAIPVTIYAMLKNHQSYPDLGHDYFDKMNEDGLRRYCLKKLEAMGRKAILEPAA